MKYVGGRRVVNDDNFLQISPNPREILDVIASMEDTRFSKESCSENSRIKSKWDVQYKSLKLDRNGRKSNKPKTIFVASPIKDLDSFHQKPFPEWTKSGFAPVTKYRGINLN